MTSFVALLRGINVGGNKLVAMPELVKFVEGLKFTEVKSLLQSGNVVFKSKSTSAKEIEDLLESKVEKRFGHAIEFFVRDAKEWQAIVLGNPFAEEAEKDPSHLVVMCLKAAPKADAVKALKAAVRGREYFEVKGSTLYVVYPDGIGESKFTNAVMDSKLGTRGTGRNWNTVKKIAALLE